MTKEGLIEPNIIGFFKIFVQQTGRDNDRGVAKLAAVGESPDAALICQCWHQCSAVID